KWSNDVCVAGTPLRLGESESTSASSSGIYREANISRTAPFLLLKIRAWGDNDKLLIRGRDDLGRRVFGAEANGAAGFRIYTLDVGDGAAWIDIDIIPEKALKTEFFVAQPKN